MVLNHLTEGGQGSGNFDHSGRPGQKGGSSSYLSPKMPPIKFNGTTKEVSKRAKERANIMETTFPGIKFSDFVGNIMGIKLGKNLGMPGIGEPQAIIDLKEIEPGNEKLLPDIISANKRWGKVNGSGYTTLNTLKIETGFDYKDILSAIKFQHNKDPYSISFSVNRLGHSTYIRFK